VLELDGFFGFAVDADGNFFGHDGFLRFSLAPQNK
jgi:hypothetical protein